MDLTGVHFHGLLNLKAHERPKRFCLYFPSSPSRLHSLSFLFDQTLGKMAADKSEKTLPPGRGLLPAK